MSASTRSPGDSYPKVRFSTTAQAAAGESAEKLTFGMCYDAKVAARQDDGTYRVHVSDPAADLNGVHLALPVLGGLMGLQVRCNLPQNTGVKIIYGSPSFIFAVVPENNADWRNALNRSLVWGDKMDPEQGVSENQFGSHAEDLLEGEVELANLYGVSMDFLTALIRMRAGHRAQVEVHLINDMVRIISGQFRHVSPLGEELMFDAGRPTMEKSWSSYRHEVLGALKEKEPYAEMKGDEVDRDALDERRITGMGRHRFLEFVGFAGDFIHSFVADPPETMVRMAKGQAQGAGKSMFHRNSDGSVIIQSVADIRLERVCRIPVPIRCEHHEDPTVSEAREYDKLEAEFLKLPTAVAPVDPKDAFQAAYHIRSYARWLGRYHSFARMLQLGDEYEIPSEANSPEPDWNNGEADRQSQNGRVKYYDSYSCMAIMRDGSQVNHDGYGSSIVMSNGNVQVSASRHLYFESGGDMQFVCGGSFHVKARRNIELSAAIGGVIIHGYAWMKLLCERGTAWLRSNAQTGPDAAAPVAKDGGPVPEVAGGHLEGFGVLVEATEGAAAYRSEKGATLAVDGSPADEDDDSCNLTVTTKGGLDLHGQRQADLHSPKLVRVSSSLDLVLASPTLLSSASKVLVGPNIEKPLLVMRQGNLWARNISAATMAATNASTFTPIGGLPPDPPIPEGYKEGDVDFSSHYNHVGKLKKEVETPEGGDADEITVVDDARLLSGQAPALPWDGSSDGPYWEFPQREEYIWDERDQPTSGIPETLTQQHLRLDTTTGGAGTDRWEGTGYDDWSLRDNIVGSRTSPTPGFGQFETVVKAADTGEDLHAPSATEAAATPKPDTSWTPKSDFTIKALKRP